MTKNRAREAAYGRFARKMRKFPPKFIDTAKPTAAAPLSAKAHAFVPVPSPKASLADSDFRPDVADIPMLDGFDAVGFEMPAEDVQAIQALRKALPAGQKIKYSIKVLVGMKPLNPNAPEFTPFWLQGIHTERDFALFQNGQLFGCAATSASSSTSDLMSFQAQKAS